ncbi:MAG: [FeFe] hydrogenase H-cluster radical SAM maturase HydG [Halanaerobiaceae bacterium]
MSKNKKMKDYKTDICDYINEKKIKRILSQAANPAPATVRRIIDKALNLNGLTPEETSVLLQVEDNDLIEEFLSAARKVKEMIYGKRLVLFAPLYFANKCSNNCLYCGFRNDNEKIQRKKLTQPEIKNEVKALEREGHKRLLVLTGESSETDLDYIIKSIKTCYDSVTKNNGEIRRINVEIAPLTVEEFQELKKAEIGTYTCFQETYHRPTYNTMHPEGPKSNFDWRLTVMDRAQKAGIDDIGIGALFGLYDYRFEVISLLLHAEYLDKTFGVGPHTISVPRFNSALGAPIKKAPYPVSDENFKKLVAVLRLAVPYTGIILTTRESEQMRNQLFLHGVSQISAGSRTTPGGYKNNKSRKQDLEQFSLHDIRPMDDIIIEITKNGYIPSFCTACYRKGRTGKDFMDLAKPGKIQEFCRPNAMLTFKEYLTDYGSEVSRKYGEKCLESLKKVLDEKNPELSQEIENKLNKIEQGDRDVYL